VKHDSTAIVAVTWDKVANKVQLVSHRIFQPTTEEPLDFERCVEGTVRQIRERFRLMAVYFDPYQMQAVAQRLRSCGVPMREYPQTMDRLTALGSNLYDLIKGSGLTGLSRRGDPAGGLACGGAGDAAGLEAQQRKDLAQN